MAIFRCNKCGHIREVGSEYVGKSVKCPKCTHVTPIHDTITFLDTLIQKYIAQNEELQRLQREASEDSSSKQMAGHTSFDDIDIHNTDALTLANNLEPIQQWFEKQNIQVQFDKDAASTIGFFDEIALSLGNQFDVLDCVRKQIKYIQNKGYEYVKIDLSKKKPKEIQQITAFCKELYDYSFVAKYFYQKKDRTVRLTLQKAPGIKRFFNGIWMEWYVLVKLLEHLHNHQVSAACTRSLEISFTDGRSNELDLFLLSADNIPICIECKSGEFRHDIDKYLSLRKRLKLNKGQFIICVFGLSQEQASGMTSMYDVTFVNERSLVRQIQTVI